MVKLVEALILQSAAGDGSAVKGLGFECSGFFGGVFAEVGSHRTIISIDLSQQCLDFLIGIELGSLFLQDQIGAHAAARKVLDTFVIFGAVGMGIEVA